MKKKYVVWLLLLLLSIEIFSRLTEDPMDADFYFSWFFYDSIIDRNIRIYGVENSDPGVVHVNNVGFRDHHDWPPKKGQHHIVVSGAGHGFGENVKDNEVWPKLIESDLNPKDTVLPVYNASVQGATILFTERVLLPTILESKPDWVILSMSGFNEALYSHTPESDILRPTGILHNFLMSFASIRQSRKLYSARNPLQHKVSLETFKNAYHRIVSALTEQGIKTILLQQVVIHPDISGVWVLEDMDLFRHAQKEIAIEYNLPIIDPAPFCLPDIEKCFTHKEWYSLDGHYKAAQAIQEHPIWDQLVQVAKD
jgi:hypothetical protein